MKNIFKFSALFCAMTFLVTSCSQDAMFEPEPVQKPAVAGDEIIFGSRAGFENGNPDTRTIYSGEVYQSNGVNFERIDWVNGDQVEIYSPEAGNGPTAHYSVTQQSVDENGDGVFDVKDEGYLTKIADNGLAWKGDGVHHFYAMYPSTMMIDETMNPNNTLVQGIKMNKTTLTGIVPHAQRSIAWREVTQEFGGKNTKKYYAMPDMKYAYMAAKSTATIADGKVSLDFVPVVTALEVELQAQNVPVTISDIRVAGSGIAGSFTADLSDAGWPAGATYPVCKQVDDSNKQDYVLFTLHEPKTLNEGESLVFTVFLRPGADYENVTVGFSQTGAGYLSNQLGNDTDKVTILASKKTVVNDFLLPKEAKDLVIDASHWLDQLPDNYELGYLSLPGTGGSFSNSYSGSDKKYYQQQTLDLDAQWKAGIRAFEVVVDRLTDTNASLGGTMVKCNKTSVEVSFDAVMTSISNKVTDPDHSKECAVVVITYQPEDNSPNRNSYGFAQNLVAWWKSLDQTKQGVYKLYEPDLTLGDVRGKVLVLVRIHQKDEGDNGDTNDATGISLAMDHINNADCPFVIISDCGTAKDRWGARGYQINGKECAHISNEKSGDENVIENHMGTNPGLSFPDAAENATRVSATSPKNSSYTISRPALGSAGVGELKFNFTTNKNFDCWYQEWARVVITPASYSYWFTTYYWFESLSEKKSNIEQTFVKAINSDPTAEGAMVYLNSLCGYAVTSDFRSSYQFSTGGTYGGAGGDIEALANVLNPWFAQLVFDAGLEQSTGPTGVIFMDRVTSNMEVIGRIISNNFKFTAGK